MCSFLAFDKKIDLATEKVNRILKLRGPDFTSHTQIGKYSFVHNLLSITGEFTPQPFSKKDCVCVFNGEIYNYKTFGDYKSDGDCLIDLYLEYGPEFVKKLDGEFALCLIDYSKNIAVVSTDVFKTKPLFLVNGSNFGCSTFKTPLQDLGYENVESMPPNCFIIVDLISGRQTRHPLYEFNLEQNKTNIDEWSELFIEAVKKRIPSKLFFIGLSGGYDSGAISCALTELGANFQSISMMGSENFDIQNKRFELLKNPAIQINKDDWRYDNSKQFNARNTEYFRLTIKSDIGDYSEEGNCLLDDYGANWLGVICREAQNRNFKVMMSGMGADEIISDYGFGGNRYYRHSNFGGLFPDNLKDIFPWGSFWHSTMESYLAKEEYVAGAYGIETRYPFLDTQLIQCFLNLHPSIKNSEYKSVIANFLKSRNYPFAPNEKRGF